MSTRARIGILYALAHDCDAEYLYLFSQLEGEPASEAKWRICKLPAALHRTPDRVDLTPTTKD